MANISDLKVNVSFWVDDRHLAPWRFRVLHWLARRLGITLMCVDAEFKA